jgi:hypothetical protein
MWIANHRELTGLEWTLDNFAREVATAQRAKLRLASPAPSTGDTGLAEKMATFLRNWTGHQWDAKTGGVPKLVEIALAHVGAELERLRADLKFANHLIEIACHGQDEACEERNKVEKQLDAAQARILDVERERDALRRSNETNGRALWQAEKDLARLRSQAGAWLPADGEQIETWSPMVAAWISEKVLAVEGPPANCFRASDGNWYGPRDEGKTWRRLPAAPEPPKPATISGFTPKDASEIVGLGDRVKAEYAKQAAGKPTDGGGGFDPDEGREKCGARSALGQSCERPAGHAGAHGSNEPPAPQPVMKRLNAVLPPAMDGSRSAALAAARDDQAEAVSALQEKLDFANREIEFCCERQATVSEEDAKRIAALEAELAAAKVLRKDCEDALGGEMGSPCDDGCIVGACLEWRESVRLIPESMMDPEADTLQEIVDRLLSELAAERKAHHHRLREHAEEAGLLDRVRGHLRDHRQICLDPACMTCRELRAMLDIDGKEGG